MGEPAVRLRPPARRAQHRQLDHAAEEEPRRGRAGARPCRADRRLPDQPDGDDEGPAARLFEGHAGRQAAGVRGARPARAVDRGDDRDDRGQRPSAPTGCAQAAELGYATATDLADWLVREADVPFREAHHITGAAVKLAESTRRRARCAVARRLAGDRSADRRARVRRAVGRSSVAARASYGGTAPGGYGSRSPRRAKRSAWSRDARLFLPSPPYCCSPPAGRRQSSNRCAGQTLPPAPYGAKAQPDAEELLALDPQAAPRPHGRAAQAVRGARGRSVRPAAPR